MSGANLPRSLPGRSATQTSLTKFIYKNRKHKKNVRAGKMQTLTLSINITLNQSNKSAQLVDCETGTELRLEPCGLRRHDVAAVGNVGELLHRNRIESKRYLHLTAVYTT